MELIKKDETNVLVEIENTNKLCGMLMQTPHYAKLGPDGIYAVVAKAKSLGMDPMDALNGALYYVKGRVGMSTEAMAARMRAAGHSIQKDLKSTNTNCILIGKRADNGDTWVTSFSIDDAKRAGLYQENGPWGKYPAVMCYNRAMSMMFRQLTPDLSKGAGYTLDELKEIAGNDASEPVVEKAEVIVETINQEQADELAEVMTRCESTYIEKIWDSLRKQNIQELKAIPVALYERILKAVNKNAAEQAIPVAMEA